jgi:hypothetical protein
MNTTQMKKRSKGIAVTGRGNLQGCEMLMIPYCLDNQFIEGG